MGSRRHKYWDTRPGKNTRSLAKITHLPFCSFSMSHVITIFCMKLFFFQVMFQAKTNNGKSGMIIRKHMHRNPSGRSELQGNSTSYLCDKAEKNIMFLKAMGGFSKATKCPLEPWILPWATKIKQNPQVKQFTVIEVGCNKATDALMLMRLFTQKEAVDIVSWLKETGFTKCACPFDWELWKKILRMNMQGLQTYHHFCLEPVQENFQHVSVAAKKFGLDRLGLHVHQLALSSSNVPPLVKFPHGAKGQESIGIDVGGRGGKTYAVNVSTLDKFVMRESIKEVNILKIDTEGNDARVLLGAVQTLTHLSPEYLTFENHKVGHWSQFDLRDVVDFLDNLFYTCFWATSKGIIVRLTGCWDARYSAMKGWSNVACYHRSTHELGRLMEKPCLDREAL